MSGHSPSPNGGLPDSALGGGLEQPAHELHRGLEEAHFETELPAWAALCLSWNVVAVRHVGAVAEVRHLAVVEGDAIRTLKLPSGIDALTADQRDALGNRVSMADPTAQLVLAKLAMEAFRRRTALDEQRRARQRR